MIDDNITLIAEQVSILMQLDRMRHHVDTTIDMKSLANVPDYIASVFEEANAVSAPIEPKMVYDLVNKRISQIQAQLYLLRVEMDNRYAFDPSKIYKDPLTIGAYGERIAALTKVEKSFSFGPEILAYGWYPMETVDGNHFRWMRPGDNSVACVPHLGTVDQILEIGGQVFNPSQIRNLSIRVNNISAKIVTHNSIHFTATLNLKAADLASTNYVAVEFTTNKFEQPNDVDTRLLGASVGRFTCKPCRDLETKSL